MKEKKLSIIIVSYNTKLSFLRTIQSIISQKNKNYEIIVIDGNSSDGTNKEIEKMSKIISKYLIEDDTGIYNAMNKGINLAKSEWSIFLNSGDIFFNDQILEKFNNLKIIDEEIIFGDTVINNGDFLYKLKGNKFENETVLMPFCHQSVIVKTHLLKSYKFKQEYKISSDFEFFLRCFIEKHKFQYFEEVISIVESGGVSDTKRQLVFNENISILKKQNKNNLIKKIYFIKFLQFIINFVKIILPNQVIKLLLNFKYRNYKIK